MKNQTCCFTGHRNIPKKEYPIIQKRLENEITNLIYQGVRFFGAGGAIVFDTMAALAVLKLKLEFPHIRLILVLPCKDQTKSWDKKDITIYNQIRDKADKVVYTSEYYRRGCMHVRNRQLANHSSRCIAYLNERAGGTAYTVNYALDNGLDVINIAEK